MSNFIICHGQRAIQGWSMRCEGRLSAHGVELYEVWQCYSVTVLWCVLTFHNFIFPPGWSDVLYSSGLTNYSTLSFHSNHCSANPHISLLTPKTSVVVTSFHSITFIPDKDYGFWSLQNPSQDAADTVECLSLLQAPLFFEKF